MSFARGEALHSVSAAERDAFGLRLMLPLAFGCVLNPVNSTLISTALVPIGRDLHASAAETGWLIAGLYLASAIAQPTMGRVADLIGARRVYLCGLSLIMLSGLVGGVASSLGALTAVRVLLGIGTSAAYPASMTIIRERASLLGSPPPRIAMGILSLASLVTVALGPVLGGVLTGIWGWHSIFLVNVPLAATAIVLVAFWIPRDVRRPGSWSRVMKELDFGGIGLFAAFMLAAMFFLMRLRSPMWALLPVAGALCTALIWHERRRTQPFIDVRMLASNVPLTVTYVRNALVFLPVYCVLYGFAQWLEAGPGFSSAKAGLITLPMSALAAVCSLLAARTKSIRGPLLFGTGSILAGCLCFLFLGSSSGAVVLAIAALLFGIPQGVLSTSIQACVYIQAPASEMGTAAGLQRTSGYIGAIAASSLLGFVFGQRANDAGFHRLMIVMGVLGAFLVITTFFDRTIPELQTAHPQASK
jgi:MFS family permease